jgi:hypothetical protein
LPYLAKPKQTGVGGLLAPSLVVLLWQQSLPTRTRTTITTTDIITIIITDITTIIITGTITTGIITSQWWHDVQPKHSQYAFN